MLELLGLCARVLHTVSGCGILGLLAFELIVRANARQHRSGDARLRAATLLAAAFLGAGILVFAAQLDAVAPGGLEAPAAWAHYAASTRFGMTWLLQHGVALPLFGALAARRRLSGAFGQRRSLLATAALALAAIPTSTFAGHAAAAATPSVAIALNWLHVVAVGSWAGGLPALLAMSLQAARGDADAISSIDAAWRRFSRLALIAMSCLVATGLATAWLQAGGIPPLLGTAYGQLVLCKAAVLAAILAIAAHLRARVLPSLPAVLRARAGAYRVAGWIAVELLLALAAMVAGSTLAGLPPARHEQVVWPLGARLAPAIAWATPGVPEQVAAGALVALAGVAGALWRPRRGGARPRQAVAAVLILAGVAVAISSLTVPANPDTYRRSALPYDAFSIANGERLFRQHCTTCHGADATGNGEAAASTQRPPADLTAPHARDHTAGDMFWWIGQGIPAGGMPGFAAVLAEDERWDLVNFVHTLAAGYQARLIRERIATRNPWLPAPDFPLATPSGAIVALQDFRERAVVLLVLFSLPQSAARLDALARSSAWLTAAGAQLILVPIDAAEGEAAAAREPQPAIAGEAAADIARAYLLFRHTLVDPRIGGRDATPRHMELLIDRYGFIRARWLPEDGTSGWADLELLAAQIGALNREGRVRDPPDAHLH